MEASKPLIESQSLPLWTAGAFILAMLALVASVTALYRIQVSVALTQAEVVVLNRQLQEVRKATVAAAPQAAPQQSVQGAGPAAAAPK